MGHVDALSRSEVVATLIEEDIEFQLCAAQGRDKKLVEIKNMLEKESSNVFDLKNGIVYRKGVNEELLFYVPNEMESEVIRTIHEKIGHLGINKTNEKIKSNYWMPHMKEKIETHIKNCIKCIFYSSPARIDEKNLHNIPKTPLPFDTIHVDHLGPLPSIKSKRKHLLVIIDAFTKYVKLYATNSTSTKEVVEALKKYFSYYSRPRRLISDRGSCFTSFEFSEFLLKNNISHVKVAVGSPQANGQVERVNRVLTPMLSKLTEPLQHSDWVAKLSLVEFGLNNTSHCSTGQTPAKLLFGIEQKGPHLDELSEFLEERCSNVQIDLKQNREKAHWNITQAQKRNEIYFDLKHRPARQYNVGDYVVIKNVDVTPGTNKKLIPKFKGPYIIDKKLPHDRYLIKDIENCQITQRPYKGVIEAQFIKMWQNPKRKT